MPYSITKNRIALITDKKDSDENYIVVIQEVDSAGRIDNRRVDVNKIITTFGKDYVEGQIKDAITENRILFADKKRSHMFSGGTSYQLARGRKTDFKDNINNFWAEVNYEEWKKNNKGQYSLREQASITSERLDHLIREYAILWAENAV